MRIENGEIIDEGETALYLVNAAEAYARYRWPEIKKVDLVVFSQNIEKSLHEDPGTANQVVDGFLERTCNPDNLDKIKKEVETLKFELGVSLAAAGSDILYGEYTGENFLNDFKRRNKLK